MVVPDLIQWKQSLIVALLLLVTSVSTQTTAGQDSDVEINSKEPKTENVTPGIVDNVYNFFSKMKSYVTGQNLEAERRLKDFKKQIFRESQSLNQVIHKLEGNVRYSNGGASGPSFPIPEDQPMLLSRKKRDLFDFIFQKDSEDNLVLTNVTDKVILVEPGVAKRHIDMYIHNDTLFLVAVNNKGQAWISSFDSELNEKHIDTLENVKECKFSKAQPISFLLMICTPPFDDDKTSIVQVVKFIKFADNNYYIFGHQKLSLEKPSTTHMWYQNQENYLIIGQYEKSTYMNKSIYQTESYTYHWTGNYFHQIEKGGILPGTSVKSLLHFQAGHNHYIAMANFENNKGVHNIFSNIFKYSLSKERYEMWHRIPTRGASHFANFTLGTGRQTENFLVVANYCEDKQTGTCDLHTNSVIYKIIHEKFAQFQCIQTHGAVQWLAIEVESGVLLAVANSLTGAAFYQYNGWKFVQMDINTELFPALGPGISSITAIKWNDNYIMGVTNLDGANMSLVYTLVFRVDTSLKRFHSDASNWCSASAEYMKKNATQPNELIKRINEVPWTNSTYNFPNDVTFKKSLIINSDSTSRMIKVTKGDIRIPESRMPIIKKQNKLEMSLDKIEQSYNNTVPLSHSWPDGLHLSKLIVESGSVYSISTNDIGGVNVDSNDLILINSSMPVTGNHLHLEQAHMQGDTALEYVNEERWSDLVTLSGNYQLIKGKTFYNKVSAVNLEVKGNFQNILFGHSQLLGASSANYTGGIICDEIVSPEVFAKKVADHDLLQLQQTMVTSDTTVYTGSLLVNNSIKALGIVATELAGQNLEEIFHQALKTNLKEKQTLLFDHRVNSASILNIHVGDRVNGLFIPKDVLINSPLLDYNFDTATFTKLKAELLAVDQQLNDIKVINESLDVLSMKEKEIQVISAFKTFKHLKLTAGMSLKNQTFEDIELIYENRDEIRKRRSASIINSLCPYGLLKKLSMLSPDEKLWHQLLLTIRTTVTARLLLQQLNSVSNSVCLTPEELMVISSLKHDVHCALNDLTIVDSIHNLFKNTCSSGLQKESFNKERLQNVKGIVDNYRQTLEKKMLKLLINHVSSAIKEKIGSYLGNHMFIVKLILQHFYSNKYLNDKKFSSDGDNKDYRSHKTALNSHVWYLLKNIDILYKIRLVNTHSIFKLKDDTASRIAKENIDILINYEMERIVKTLSIIESINKNLCSVMSNVQKYMKSEEHKNIVFMLQMYKNMILASLLDVHNPKKRHDLGQNEMFDRQLHLYIYDNKEESGNIEGGGHMEEGAHMEGRQNEYEETGKIVKKIKVNQIEDDPLSRHKRSTNNNRTSISDLEDVLNISENSTIILEMLSNSRMVKKFLNRFNPFLSLNKSVHSNETDKILSEDMRKEMSKRLDRMINVTNNIISNPNDILRWDGTEVQNVDGIVHDAFIISTAFQYQLTNISWNKIADIKNIVPIAKNKTDQVQNILLEKLYNFEHHNDTKRCSIDEYSGSCGSIAPNVIDNIEEEIIKFYVLNDNYIKDNVNENFESCTSNSTLCDYLKLALDYLSAVWKFAWFDVYVDSTKKNSIVSSKIGEIANETTQILDVMFKSNQINKDFGYSVLMSECLEREINSLDLAVEILRIVKVQRGVKTALIHLKHHNELVELTSSISKELLKNFNESVCYRKSLINSINHSGTDNDSVGNETKQNVNDNIGHNNSVGNRKKRNSNNSVKNNDLLGYGKKQLDYIKESENPRRRGGGSGAEPMVDSSDVITQNAIEFIKHFDRNYPMYILNKTNVKKLLYYYSVNTILNQNYSHIISKDFKYRMDQIAERIPNILMKLDVLKIVDQSRDEMLVKSKLFNITSVLNLASGQLKDNKDNNNDFTKMGFKWSANANINNNSEPNTYLSRFKRDEKWTVLSDKLNSKVELIDYVLIHHIGKGFIDISEIRKKIQCFMELDDFNYVLLALDILEKHIRSLVIQDTNLPNSAKDSEHEIHGKIEHFINYHTMKVIKTLNNVKDNFGKALTNINTKMLSEEAENYKCVSEILSAAGYIPCNINSKIKCIHSAIVDIQYILNFTKAYISEQQSLASSPYINSLCYNKTFPVSENLIYKTETDTVSNNKTNPVLDNIRSRIETDTVANNITNPVLDNIRYRTETDTIANISSKNWSQVSIAIYDAEETISYLNMYKKINPLPVLISPSEVNSSNIVINNLLEVERFIDSIIEEESHFINETHFINNYNRTQLPFIFLKLKNAMAIVEENDSINNIGLKILDKIFGTLGQPGRIDRAILKMEQNKQQYEQVLHEMKLSLPDIDFDEPVPEVTVTHEKVVIPVLHDRISTVSGLVAGYNLREILSHLYLNETANKFLADFNISNVHNVTISGSLTVHSHINGISPNILNQACPLRKPYNDITFVFNKPVIIENNFIAYYLSSIPFENYVTTVGKHVFYKDASFVGGVKFQDDVLVRSKVNDHDLYHLTTNIAQNNASNIFKGNLAFYNIKSENINVMYALVKNVDFNNIVTLKGTDIVTGNIWFSNIRTNTNLSVSTMQAEIIDTKYNSNVEVDKIFQNNFRKNPNNIQVLSGVQVFRNLTFNVDANVSVGIFDYTLNSLSKQAVYKDKSVNFISNLRTFNNTKIDNLNFFSTFDNVSSLESWMMKNGDQYINSYSSFTNLKAKNMKIKNNISMSNGDQIKFDNLLTSTIKIDEPSFLNNNILWNFIKVEGANISVDGLVQGVDISDETVVKDSLDVNLGGNKYFQRSVNFNQFLDINGLFNKQDLDLLCSDYYFKNLIVYGDWIIDSLVNTNNVTCHSKKLPEKNWASCWQADKNYIIKDDLHVKHFEIFDGLFNLLSSNISLPKFQNEVLRKNSSELQSIKCVVNFNNVEVNDIKTNSLTTNKLGKHFANDLYDMFTRNDNQNIAGLYDLNSALMIEKMVGPDTFNNVTLDHYCQHSNFCQVYAEKSMQSLNIENFLKPHINCVIQGIDISEWWEKALKTDSSPKTLPSTLFTNLKIIKALKTAGLVDGVEMDNLLQKSVNQTIEAALLLNNTDNDVLILRQLDIHDGEINAHNLAQLVDRLVFVDKPAIVQSVTQFQKTNFHYADYSKKLASLKKTVDWLINESSVVHHKNEIVTLSHLAMIANKALPRQPVKFEGWIVVQEITGKYNKVKALNFEAENISPVYLALLTRHGPPLLLEHNPKTDTYDPCEIQIAGNCTTAISAFRSRGEKYIINSNACGLNNNTYLQTHGISHNTSLGFTLVWQMQKEEPKLKLLWLINTKGACDHEVMELRDDLCILLICDQGFDLKIMCSEKDISLREIQNFEPKYPVIKASAIAHTNELGKNNFLAMVDSKGLSLYLYDKEIHKFTLLETKHVHRLNWIDLVSHNGDLFISTISRGFRGLERGMIFVYKLDFNHLDMQYNHTSVLLRFVSPVSSNITTPKIELYSSIPEDMPIECHFTILQSGELSLFVTSGSGIITRLSQHGVEGFRRSGDVLVPGSTTLEVWNNYRNGSIFTRLAPSSFSKMQVQKTVILESSYLENTEDYSTCTIRGL